MYYEVYIDVVFVTNLLMDYILLRLVGRLMHFGCTRRRCALGAFLGAVFSSLMLFVRMDVVPVRIMLHGGCGVMMAVFTFRLKKGSLLMKALAAMYMTAFLMGGLWEMAAGRGKFTWLTFCILGVGSFGLMDVAVYLGDLFRVHRKNIYPVTLSYGKNIQTLYGFYDTGNLLTDPGTGKPVSLVKAEYIKESGYMAFEKAEGCEAFSGTIVSSKTGKEVEADVETESESETESETERNVLFRIKISNTTGTYVRNKPNNVEFEDCFLVDYGTEYDVYSVYDNDNEGCSYYEVEVNGKTEYVWEEDAEIL